MRAVPLKEHPLAGRRVVLNSDLPTGALSYVLDWWDRRPGLCPGKPGLVVIRAAGLVCTVQADELPAYDPVPVGVIS